MSGSAPQGLAIVGATATGKSELSIAVAGRVDGEIVGVDSRQAYRGMAVGTGAPHAAQLKRVPHHGIGFLDPTETYSAGSFASLAREWILEIRSRDRVPVLVGGTGFFLRALVRPVFAEPEMDSGRRRRLRDWLDALPIDELRRWVRRLDPEWTAGRQTLDRQRAGRSVELALLSGRPLGFWHESEPSSEPVLLATFGLALPAELHRERIRARVRHQMESGWPGEVEALREAGVPADAPALDAVGYREVAALLDGGLDREAAIDAIARKTWGYARRQRTWFRHQLPGIVWLDASASIEHLAGLVEREWRTR